MMRAILDYVRGMRFGYDAVEETGRRKAIPATTRREDEELSGGKRRQLIATARDLPRNFAIGAWAIRKHLDYVSSFRFQARTESEALNTRIEELMQWWGRRKNCDRAERHSLRRMIRLAEASRTRDGDVLCVKLADGRLQWIESDLIKNPPQAPRHEWIEGVSEDRAGRAIGYGVYRHRRGFGPEFERVIPASNALLFGYVERFNQSRGVSPLAAALNQFRDCYEAFGYALAKAKISQLFGLVTYREEHEENDGLDDEGRIDYTRGPFQLNFSEADRAEFLESKTPSTEFQSFMEAVIMAALKALDIPYSFFDEAHTNFYGSRGGLQQYLNACKSKRADLAELLDELTVWRLSRWIAAGVLVLPGRMTLADLSWEWVHDGVPWWDPLKEVKGQQMAIEACLDTPQRICRENSTDYFENVDAIAKARDYAKAKGITPAWAAPKQIEGPKAGKEAKE